MLKPELKFGFAQIGLLLAFIATGGVSNAFAEQGTCRVANAGTSMELAADCGEYAYNVKHGNCKYACKVHENMSTYNVDLSDVGATTGKRTWNAKSQHTFTYAMSQTSGGLFNCNSSNTNKCQNDCNNYFNYIKTTAAAGGYDTIRSYCPDASKASYKVQGLTVDPAQQCSAYDPYTKCDHLRPDYGIPQGDGWCADDPSGSGIPSNDPDCVGYTGPTPSGDWTAYFQCYTQYSQQYNTCYNNIVNDPGNMNAGPTDCYCNSSTDYYKFDTVNGAWKCVPCANDYPVGWVQDTSTGKTCKSTCQPSETYDPVTKTCVQASNCTSDPTKEIYPPPPAVGGQCVTKCQGSQQRDTAGVCRDVCPRGMKLDALTNTCGCNDPAFSGNPRSPVRQSAISGLRYPAWVYGGTIPANPNPDNTLSCACAAVGAPSNVSMMDFTEALTDPQARSLPIGLVSVVAGITAGGGGTSLNNYQCGCPNLNEKFKLDTTDGRYKCMPSIGGSGGAVDGRVLAVVPDPGADAFTAANKVAAGIVDALSDLPNRPIAMVRSQVTGYDTSVLYRRKVWKCADGFFLNGANQCVLIASDPAHIAENNCSDATPVKSSNYQPAAVQAVFGTLTNKMLACCMSQKAASTDPTKFHCVATPASLYTDFDAFYNAGSGGSTDFSGVTNPTRFYLKDNAGKPVPGVYNREGNRCKLLDGLTASAQMAALNTVRANILADIAAHVTGNPFRGIAGVTASTLDQENCRFVVRTALEVVCPPDGPDANGNLQTISYPKTDATYLSADNNVHRCFQADALRVHYAIEDLSDPTVTHRPVLRKVSSVGPNSEPAGSVDISRLIRGN
ncbi:MAG: hypothetical protein JST04_08040 [Bdellovibrionales bacterium]|nr:hypothetical protein [Bdellovibrionales bacterium]